MAGLLYFLPKGRDAEEFIAARRAVWGVGGFDRRHVSAGPDGGEGQILSLADQKNAARVGYYPSEQEWHKTPAADWWIGWSLAERPRPQDLQRPDSLPGHNVRLEDGQEWTVPVVRFINGVIALPQRLVLDDQGNVARAPLDRYANLTRIALEIWEKVAAAAEGLGVLRVEWEYAVAALAANYRLGGEEISALGLLTDANVAAVLLALIDWPRLLAMLEASDSKKASSGASTASGETDSPPDTPQVAPTLNST